MSIKASKGGFHSDDLEIDPAAEPIGTPPFIKPPAEKTVGDELPPVREPVQTAEAVPSPETLPEQPDKAQPTAEAQPEKDGE